MELLWSMVLRDVPGKTAPPVVNSDILFSHVMNVTPQESQGTCSHSTGRGQRSHDTHRHDRDTQRYATCVRLGAATVHRALTKQVNNGRFRSNFYKTYRDEQKLREQCTWGPYVSFTVMTNDLKKCAILFLFPELAVIVCVCVLQIPDDWDPTTFIRMQTGER